MKGVAKKAASKKKPAPEVVAGSGVDDDEPSRKKSRMQHCLACKRQPGPSVPWDAVSPKGVAVGSQCASCAAQWSQCFSYMGFEEYAGLLQTEAMAIEKTELGKGPQLRASLQLICTHPRFFLSAL